MEKFDGFHKEVTKNFARVFDGVEVEIGDIKFTVEKWFKNRGIKGDERRVSLKKPNMDITIFRKGIPSSELKSKWRNFLVIIQKFVTCEGRFRCVSFYHIRLLMNFFEEHEMNLPYFLLNSLKKMSRNVQKKIQFI